MSYAHPEFLISTRNLPRSSAINPYEFLIHPFCCTMMMEVTGLNQVGLII